MKDRLPVYKILRDLADGLMNKYMGAYYGYKDVSQVGNSANMDDGMVSDTLLSQKLTNDTAKLRTPIEGLQHKKGFIRMAQALTRA